MNNFLKVANRLIIAAPFLVPHSQASSLSGSEDLLFASIAALDAAVFDAFNNCSNPEQLQKHLSYFSQNVEFYHDTGGVTWSREEMRANIEKYVCNQFRRELVKDTLKCISDQKFWCN